MYEDDDTYFADCSDQDDLDTLGRNEAAEDAAAEREDLAEEDPDACLRCGDVHGDCAHTRQAARDDGDYYDDDEIGVGDDR